MKEKIMQNNIPFYALLYLGPCAPLVDYLDYLDMKSSSEVTILELTSQDEMVYAAFATLIYKEHTPDQQNYIQFVLDSVTFSYFS
jgi:hypothetical protein